MATPKLHTRFFDDFTGGLNLRTQRQNLALNESPDCADVDFNQRGGIQLRKGYSTVTADANMSTTASISGGYLVGQFSFGTDKLWGSSNVGRLWTWDGATATHVATAITSNTTTEKVRGDVWTTKLYLANAYNGGTTLIMRTWNDTVFATLTNTANDNYTAPTGGNAPLSRLICSHGGYMWWGDTVEAGTRFRSRIRFSHPLQPEDFANADYFDIEPDDQTDQITALIPFRGQLLVFKKKAVYAVYGTSRDDFVVERISNQGGTVCQETVDASAQAVFWWSSDGEVFAYNGKDVTPIGYKISILASNGTLTPGNTLHTLRWAENRLWLTLRYGSGTQDTFVYDPFVGQGAWTHYLLPISSMVWWRKVAGSNGIMIRVDGKAGVHDINVSSQKTDNGTVIAGYYKTTWYSADDTALLKRFKRPYVTASCEDDATLNMEVYLDFDESNIKKTLLVPVSLSTGGTLWNGSTWNGGLWSSGSTIFAFKKAASTGRGHAVQYKIYMTDHLGGWTLDSFALPYYEKAYR